jgi:hypothetical protein
MSAYVKYLETTFDRKLLWNEHVNNIANRTSVRISEIFPPFRYYSNISTSINAKHCLYDMH